MTSGATSADVPVDEPELAIILPSFRDDRILNAITSIRQFDDIETVQIIVIDGGSPVELIEQIRPRLRGNDILVSEPDNGIFDGLNKGLALATTKYIGWLGSDDLFSDKARASEVVEKLSAYDVFVGALYLCDRFTVQRKTGSWMAARGLAGIGLHNPHYATFGRADVFKRHKFDENALAADIGYFLAVFADSPRVAHSNEIFVLQEMGGFSIASKSKVLKVNRNAFSFYRHYSNFAQASLAILLKLGYKLLGSLYYRVRAKSWEGDFPVAASILNGSAPVQGEVH